MIFWYLIAGNIAFVFLPHTASLLGHFIKKKDSVSNYHPKTSIVVATWNEERNIAQCLDSLFVQNYSNDYEIIVSGGGTDNTPKIVVDLMRQHRNLKFLKEEKPNGKWSALNSAISKSKYDYIALIDADAVAGKSWLKNLMLHIKDYDIVDSFVKSYNTENSFISRIHNFLSSFYFTSVSFFDLFSINTVTNGSNMAFRKEVWEQVKFENYLVEDGVFGLKAINKGFRKKFSKNAFLYIETPETLDDFRRQYGRIIRGTLQIISIEPSKLKKFLYVIFVLFNIWSFTSILVFISVILGLINTSSLVIYFFALLYTSFIGFIINSEEIGPLRAILYTHWMFIFIPMITIIESVNYLLLKDKRWTRINRRGRKTELHKI